MFSQDTIAMLIGILIVGCPIGIGLFLVFNTLRKEILKGMQQGKTFWQALNSCMTHSGHKNTFITHNSQISNSRDISTPTLDLMNNPIYRHLPSNIYHYQTTTRRN